MTTLKKIILFLFGIVLIVFGNKAAIDTIFKTDEAIKNPDSEEKEIGSKKPVITEVVEKEVVNADTVVSSPKKEVKSEETNSKKNQPKESKKASVDKIVKEEPKPLPEKVEEVIKETPKTTIEPVQEETAAASE